MNTFSDHTPEYTEVNAIPFQGIHKFRLTSTKWISMMSFVMLLPFTIQKFIIHEYGLGIGILFILIVSLTIAISAFKGRYHPLITFITLTPGITLFLFLALQDYGVITSYWFFPAVVSFYFLLPEKLAWASNMILLITDIPFTWFYLEQPVAIRLSVTLMFVSLATAMLMRSITKQSQYLSKMAITDPLTSLLNRSTLTRTLDQAMEHFSRLNLHMTLLAIDIDHFKEINDQYGHDRGDFVLKEVGTFLLNRMRTTDTPFRIGGEEFQILLYGSDLSSGKHAAEEIRKEIEKLPLVPRQKVTVSIGVSTLKKDDTRESWVKRADQKLYEAKNMGRNRVCS